VLESRLRPVPPLPGSSVELHADGDEAHGFELAQPRRKPGRPRKLVKVPPEAYPPTAVSNEEPKKRGRPPHAQETVGEITTTMIDHEVEADEERARKRPRLDKMDEQGSFDFFLSASNEIILQEEEFLAIPVEDVDASDENEREHAISPRVAAAVAPRLLLFSLPSQLPRHVEHQLPPIRAVLADFFPATLTD